MLTVEEELDGEEIRRDRIMASGNARVLTSAEITSIHGETFVESIDYIQKGEKKNLEVDGVFEEIGSIPSTSYLPAEVELNRLGEIVIDANNHTNLPGLLAAGDVTSVIEKQTIIAAGEGAKAGLMVHSWLSEKGFIRS